MGLLLRTFTGLWRFFLGDTSPTLGRGYLWGLAPWAFTGGQARPGSSERMQRTSGKYSWWFPVWCGLVSACPLQNV